MSPRLVSSSTAMLPVLSPTSATYYKLQVDRSLMRMFIEVCALGLLTSLRVQCNAGRGYLGNMLGTLSKPCPVTSTIKHL